MKNQNTLASLVKRVGLSSTDLANAVGISKAALSQINCHGEWPKRKGLQIKLDIIRFLTSKGIKKSEINAVLKYLNAPTTETTKSNISAKETLYMKRKQTLSLQARKHFNVVRDIFNAGLTAPEDVFFNQDLRFLRELMREAVRSGSMLALYGESGCGKTTLVQEMIDQYRREGSNTVVITPYVVGMTTNRYSTLALHMGHICEAVIKALNGPYRSTSSPEARFEQMHKALIASSESGFKHVLIIEEAHNLPIETIKQLKRLNELANGFTRLLSIILVGQNELRGLLSETNASLREVVQRMELVELKPLNEVQSYIAHRCERAGAKFEDIFDASSVTALQEVLTLLPAKGQRKGKSMLYPLFVGNILTAAINLAAEIGAPKVTGDVVKQAHAIG